MYNEVHQYDLRFVAGVRPELVFVIKAEDYAETLERIQVLVERSQESVNTYCGHEVAFLHSEPEDMFGHSKFGYQGCGYITRENQEVWFRITLGAGSECHYATSTFNLLATALLPPLEKSVVKTNQVQQVDIETLTSNHHINGYGHAVGGYVSASLLEWLQSYAAQGEKIGDILEDSVPLPDEVVEAMEMTWRAVSPKDMHEWTREIYGWIRPEGHFSLNCFGNACDLSVYPDERVYPGRSVRLGCHNLDSAQQQLTLLAGLIQLCQLAREEPKHRLSC